MSELKTNYKDDKLPLGGVRRYRKVDYDDGTFSLVDVTEYEELGDEFKADDINKTNTAVNSNTSAITQLNSEMQYKNISHQITHGNEVDVDAYTESGVVCITLNIHSGTKGLIHLIIDEKYAPRTIINGIFSSLSSEGDFNKFGGAHVDNACQIYVWITDTLTYNEKVTFTYPLKLLT